MMGKVEVNCYCPGCGYIFSGYLEAYYIKGKATVEISDGLAIAHFCNECLPVSNKKAMHDKAGGF